MGTKNVLIIDGHEAMQNLRARVLRSRGVHVHTAKSVTEFRPASQGRPTVQTQMQTINQGEKFHENGPFDQERCSGHDP